jgi:hypothetical protein
MHWLESMLIVLSQHGAHCNRLSGGLFLRESAHGRRPCTMENVKVIDEEFRRVFRNTLAMHGDRTMEQVDRSSSSHIWQRLASRSRSRSQRTYLAKGFFRDRPCFKPSNTSRLRAAFFVFAWEAHVDEVWFLCVFHMSFCLCPRPRYPAAGSHCGGGHVERHKHRKNC